MNKVQSIDGKYKGLQDGSTVMLFNTELTQELIEEGRFNDLKRFVQNIRKNHKLDLSDRIKIVFSNNEVKEYEELLIDYTNKDFLDLIIKFEDQLKKEILATNIMVSDIPYDEKISPLYIGVYKNENN